MKPLLIGSRALHYWDVTARLPVDYDLFILSDQLAAWEESHRDLIKLTLPARPGKIKHILHDGTQIEWETEHEESVLDFLSLGDKPWPTRKVYGLDCNVASVDMLFALKKSHIYYPVNWFKHIEDYGRLQNLYGHVSAELATAFKHRCDERKARGRMRTKYSLDVPNEEFFEKSEGSLNRKFKHDDLHNAIKLYDAPLYTLAKKDQSKAILDKEMFFSLSNTLRQQMVAEEASVIALERVLIPKWFDNAILVQNGIIDGSVGISEDDAAAAFKHGMMRICTTLTTGWFREYAVDNYQYINRPDYHITFVDRFLDGSLAPL